jgi:succinoglycan biosynthesis transport protein ExoP
MPTDEGANQFAVRDILAIIWRRKWLIMLPAILVSSLTFGASYLLTPKYETSTIVQVDPQINLINEIRRLVGQDNYMRQSPEERSNRLASIYNELTSSHYTALLDERLQLSNDPEVNQRAQAIALAQPGMTARQAQMIVLQDDLRANIRVSWVSGDQIKIISQSADPARARQIANALGEIFIDEKVKQELLQIRTSQDFSDIQLEKFERQLSEKTQARTDLEKEMLAIKLDESITSESNRQEITAEIDRTTNEISELLKQETTLLGELNAVDGLSSSELGLQSSDLKRNKWQELRNELSRIGDNMIKYSWSDPQILNFKLKLNNLLSDIEEENSRLVREQYGSFDDITQSKLIDLFNTRTNLEYLTAKGPYLESAIDKLTNTMNLIPEYQARLNQINREINELTDLTDRFKRQQASSTISQDLVRDVSSSKYRIVEPARLPLGPIYPDRKRFLMIAIVLGLAIGGGVVLLVELLDTSFKKPEDAENELGIPVVGIVPKIEYLKKVPH